MMRTVRTRVIIFFLISFSLTVFAGCGGGGGGGSTYSAPSSSGGSGGLSSGTNGALGANVIKISVGGNTGIAGSYDNEPLVSVTVCVPGSTNCQTINDILLDTGSYGLRVFKKALNLSLSAENTSTGQLAECQQYADGSADWGPIEMADVALGNETAPDVPIQVIDSNYPGSANCQGNLDESPSVDGYNGILGIGPFQQDCGPDCTSLSNLSMFSQWPYWSCNSGTCTSAQVSLADQVQNPITRLPKDNNGFLINLPSVPQGAGTASVRGSLVLGIGTESNNTPSLVTTILLSDTGDFSTVMADGISRVGFIDTGSNGLFFPQISNNLPICNDNPQWYCPQTSFTNTAAQEQENTGRPLAQVTFTIGNNDSLMATGNGALNIGGPSPGSFDWGLPFYFGRTVYMGIDGIKSSLSPQGDGPYFAY